MGQLKPCPFCGGEAALIKMNDIVGHGMSTTYFFVECSKCGSRGTTFDAYLDGYRNIEDKAINAWNTRASNKIGSSVSLVDGHIDYVKEN